MNLEGRHVLVTGAGGSIGSQLCRQMLASADCLTMVSLTEGGLYTINKALRQEFPEKGLIPVVGSVTNRALMQCAMKGVDVVIHAAAHKHVPLCETNQVEAISNNVFGTMSLALAAADAGVPQFCMISSDKAVRPASIMGATKRLAELLVSEMGAGYCTVRFGNVMDSAGSVLPLWREQIEAGGPVTLTDLRCERYFMSIASAVHLVASVIDMNPDRGTFVLDMGRPKLLWEMANELMQEMGKTVRIDVIGLRPGEKLTEELHHGGELKPTVIEGVNEVSEPPRRKVSRQKLRHLSDACKWCDADKAVPLLWELVA
jgi:FlaA1/EpsC-like NDP-sugar epimerase